MSRISSLQPSLNTYEINWEIQEKLGLTVLLKQRELDGVTRDINSVSMLGISISNTVDHICK